MAAKTQILVLGATGGSIVIELLKAKDHPYILSALVRRPEQVDKLKDVGVKSILFKGLDDVDAIRNAAKDHDIIIAAASARNANSAKACLEGLAERKRNHGKEVHYIHISGTSMIGDWPETGERIDTSIHSDIDEDIYVTERDHAESHSPVRAVDQLVVNTGEKENVKTYIIPGPLIWLFTEGFGQVHMMVQLALKKRHAVHIGSGSGIWNRVHILDLTKLFSLIVNNIISNKEIPSGKTGYYFAENGFQTWHSIAAGIGWTGYEIGVIDTPAVANISLEEVADEFFGGDTRDAEGVLASNSRTKADRARQVLGWKPTYGDEAWIQEIKEVVTTMSKESGKDHSFR
ncbi:hypothetical protein D0Z07_2622 [Hyphodiscus hymeniophilus]|uniref:NAD(P)-binding domain-containing protein n=1 Tax=Hyphodiscus hymeniophilus TaxID=353542 RepID=A0A9P7AZ00_9HELO|nr:hypothetical protein D0Z07_2622 [Hyphodiscus hymeniophilus]